MATDPPAMPAFEALWRFVLDVYGRPEVASACLELQDRRSEDVCLLLFAVWAGAACRHRLTAAEAERLRRSVAPWREEIVLPLRALRRRLKAGPPPAPDAATAALRRRVQDAEIEAERIELSRLAALLPLAPVEGCAPAPPSLVLANLAAVCLPQGPADEAAFARIVEAATR